MSGHECREDGSGDGGAITGAIIGGAILGIVGAAIGWIMATQAAGLARPAETSGDRRGRRAQPRLGARQLVLGAVLP